jgi:hypothetical protein
MFRARALPHDFICIGSTKCGTTWLFANLVKHPDIWLPPQKSVHYYAPKYSVRWAKKLYRGWPRLVRPRDLESWAWDLRFFARPVLSEAGYARLMRPRRPNGRKIGEIAAYYHALDLATVRRIAELRPDLKVIFLMRDPVDRTWSNVNMRIRGYRRIYERLSADDLKAELAHPNVRAHSDYLGTLDTWQAVFPTAHIYVDFFDRIANEPHAFLADLCRFLEVPYDRARFTEAIKKVYEGSRREMPDWVRSQLVAEYADQMLELSRRYGSYPQVWARRYGLEDAPMQLTR